MYGYIHLKWFRQLDFWTMSTSRPSRVKVAFIYYKRLLRWRRNSSPYISCDSFSDLADFVYKPPRWRNFNKFESPINAQVIFCESHNLQEFLNTYEGKLTAKVIITGNSDYEFHEMPRNIPQSVQALFLQNSFISDNKYVFTVPIGLENFRLGVNGNPRYITYRPRKPSASNRILFGPLSATHPIRQDVIQTFSSMNERWVLLSERLSPKEYDRTCTKYGFIAAVRGNGVDTHRLWEALYRGLTPIVARDKWWISIEHLYPQVISIESWNRSEIDNLIKNHDPYNFNPGQIEALWMPYWIQKIASFLE